MFGKKIALVFLIGILAGTPVFAGCTSKSDALMQEYKERGIAQMEVGDYAGAAVSFQSALDQSVGRIRSEELDICYYRALALFLAGETEDAIEAYTALIDYDEKNWEVYYLRGNVYLKEGQENAALNDYAEAVSLNDDDPELCVNIYVNLCNAGLEAQAQSYRDLALAIKPSDAEDYYYLGELCYLSGDYESAMTYLTTACEKDNEEAILLLGILYAELGDSASAQAMFASYLELYPDDPVALAKVGEMALSAEEYEESIRYLTSAAQMADEEILGDIVKNLVAAYEYSGDFVNAYRIAGEYLVMHTDGELSREYEFLGTRLTAEERATLDGAEKDGEVEGVVGENPSDEESGEGN